MPASLNPTADVSALGADEARRLFDLGHAVAIDQDLPSVFRLAMEACAALVRADEVFLFVEDSQKGPGAPSLRACMHGVPPQTSARAHDCEPEARAMAIAALRGGPWRRSGPGSFECVLLASRDLALGCLVAARLSEEAFESQARLRLRWIADSVSLALQSAERAARQQHHAREILLLTDVASQSAELSVDGFMPAIAARIGREYRLGFCGIYFLDPQRAEVVLAHGWRPGGTYTPALSRVSADVGLFGRVLSSLTPRRGDTEDLILPEWVAQAGRLNVSHFLVMPLVAKGRAIGLLVVGRDKPITDEEARILFALCIQVAVVADNTQLLGEARRRATDLALLQSIGLAMSGSLDTNAVLRAALDALRSALEVDGVRVYRRRGGVFESLMYKGPILAQRDDWKTLEAGHPLLKRPLEAGRAVELPPEALPDPVRSALQEIQAESLAAVPLLLTAVDRGESSSDGVLVVGRHVRRPFGTSELAMLDAVAGQLTIALRNAELYEETRRRAEDLTIMYEAGRALLDGTTLDTMLERTAVQLARLAGVRAAVFLLVDEERQNLVGRSPRPSGPPVEYCISLTSASLAAQAVRELRPCESRDLSKDEDVAAARLDWEPGWALALPLRARDQTLGVMILADPDTHRQLSSAETDHVMAVGNQVAIAVDRARIMAALATSLRDLEEAQKQLVRRERLAALGGLAAHVAHEVRNPLGVIINSLGLLSKLADLSGDARRVYSIIREEAGRIDQIVNDMLDYTRPTEPRLVPGDVARVLGDAVASARAAERSRGTPVDEIRTETVCDPRLPPVPMDDRLLHQALVNLLSNAYQSTGGAGTVRVEATLLQDDRACIRISDSGPGLTDDARAHLFEPFFTTKAKGSGLGLAMVKRIVDGHRWEIDVRTERGNGTQFTITFPLGPRSADG